MALIKCPECGKEISDKSEKCVNCGYPIPSNVNIEQQNVSSFQSANATNDSSIFFSNKARADRIQIVSLLITIPLLLLEFFLIVTSGGSFIVIVALVIVELCLTPMSSYIEVHSDTIYGRGRMGEKFTIKPNDITTATYNDENLTIIKDSEKHVAYCGNDGDIIISYINQIKQAQIE